MLEVDPMAYGFNPYPMGGCETTTPGDTTTDPGDTTGVNNLTPTHAFDLYPNPTSGQFQVALSNIANQKVTIRFSHKNPKCLPDYRQHSQHLKKVLQELKIAPWLRKRIPFLYYDDQLVAALGYFVCKPFVASDGETNLSLYCSFKNKSR